MFISYLIILIEKWMTEQLEQRFAVPSFTQKLSDDDQFYFSLDSAELNLSNQLDDCNHVFLRELPIIPKEVRDQHPSEKISSHLPPHPSEVPSPTQQKVTSSRKDKLTHNLAQNLSSSIKTKVLKILSVDFRGKKVDKDKLKGRYENFLRQNGATNNGLIVLFVYLFMLKECASTYQIEQLQTGILNFLKEKIQEASTSDGLQEGEAYIQKLKIHKRLTDRYLDGCNEDIDVEWVKSVASGLFTGRQGKVITKPLAALENIQKSLMSSSSDSLSQSQLIQSVFESTSRD